MLTLPDLLPSTDEQLQAASKGLSGQAMPNFKSIGKDLAKEMNFEPPAETEDESKSSRARRLTAHELDLTLLVVPV